MSNPDLATVENHLQALENRVTKNAARAKSRLTLTIVVMACSSSSRSVINKHSILEYTVHEHNHTRL